MLSADDLLAGPRGRRLCLAVAHRGPLACVEAMDESVSSAMYWQPSHDEDVEAADPAVWPVQPVGRPRVCEVDGPQAWVDLVERYRFEVSASRRHDWYRATGRAGA